MADGRWLHTPCHLGGPQRFTTGGQNQQWPQIGGMHVFFVSSWVIFCVVKLCNFFCGKREYKKIVKACNIICGKRKCKTFVTSSSFLR